MRWQGAQPGQLHLPRVLPRGHAARRGPRLGTCVRLARTSQQGRAEGPSRRHCALLEAEASLPQTGRPRGPPAGGDGPGTLTAAAGGVCTRSTRPAHELVVQNRSWLLSSCTRPATGRSRRPFRLVSARARRCSRHSPNAAAAMTPEGDGRKPACAKPPHRSSKPRKGRGFARRS